MPDVTVIGHQIVILQILNIFYNINKHLGAWDAATAVFEIFDKYFFHFFLFYLF